MSMSQLFRAPRREPAAPAAPAQTKPPPVEQLTLNDVRGHDLSVAAINALIPINPSLVAQLITDAGKRARGELPATPPPSALHPTARAVILAGEKARGRTLDVEEAEFLSTFVEDHWPSWPKE